MKVFKKLWFKRLLSGILIFIIIMLALQLIPPKKVVDNNSFIRKENQGVLIAAHRGGRALNPENTQKAYDYSIAMYGIDILELDLVMTKDEKLVAIHDSTLNRTSDVEEVTGIKGKDHYVKDYTLDELLNFNMGYNFKNADGIYPYRDLVSFTDPNRKQVLRDNKLSIITINEIFERYKDFDLMYIIEIKDDGDSGKKAADQLNSLLTTYDLFEKVTIGSFHDDISKYLKEKYPKILKGGSVGDVTGFVVTQMLGVNIFNFNNFACLQIPTDQSGIKLDKKTYIKRAHRRGMSVQYWTINDKEEMKRLMDLGADVIMTDHPDVLFELLVELGYR
jgi:glycerophosphoryl diester phosphodiesterase